VRRVDPSGVSIGAILDGDPCLPADVSISSIDNNRQQSQSFREHPEGFGSWIKKAWDSIRNAVKKISIKITIPWSTIENWLTKLGVGWSATVNPSDDQDVIFTPPPGSHGMIAFHWRPPPPLPGKPVRPPPDCNVRSGPGQPQRQCPRLVT
jgi:hypothetical protein